MTWAGATVAAVSLALMLSYHFFVARPLTRIVDGAERLAEGDRSHRIELPRGDEMALLADSINRMAERVAKSQTELELQVAERTADLRAVLAEVHERSRIVEEVNQQLAEIDRRRSEFLTNVSHELRTPLNAVLGYLQLILDKLYENEDELIEFVGNARLGANHLLELVTGVLDATQIEAGNIRVDIESFHPGDVVHEVLRIMEVRAREKDLSLSMEVDGQAMVEADADKVRQVLVNLVGNALKYTDRGRVVVRTRVEDDTVRFEVEDTGVGIPEEELQRIFVKFHQVSATTERWSGGTGLGLSIARELVHLMGGTIGAHSDGPGRGALFHFSLPAAKPARATS
jgi:signal transduction histidine kinase